MSRKTNHHKRSVCLSLEMLVGLWFSCLPYLPYNWTGRCTWGYPYILACILSPLQQLPSNWVAVHSHHPVQHTSGSFCTLAIFFTKAAAIDVEWQVSALAQHMVAVLNNTRHAITLLNEKISQMRKVVLQNRMALDMFTAAQGRTCALVKAECSAYQGRMLCLYPGWHS